MTDIPTSSIDRIIRKAGAERVSQDAILRLKTELEDYGLLIAKKALEFARYANKKTISKADIELALLKK